MSAKSRNAYTTTELGYRKGSQFSTAPNGSSKGTDYYTWTYEIQDWHETEENGIYAGCSYLITREYISQDPNRRGQYLHSYSRPLEGSTIPEDLIKA